MWSRSSFVTAIAGIVIALIILSALIASGCSEDPVAPEPTGIAALYDRQPSEDSCDAGVLKSSVKQRVLQRLNEFRARHGLPPVIYDDQYDQQEQQAAFMAVRNRSLSPDPPRSWRCWTEAGSRGSIESNLWSASAYRADGIEPDAMPSENIIDFWLKDSAVTNLAHRRWLLNPFLRNIAFGRADLAPAPGELRSAAALRILERNSEPIDIPDTVRGYGFPQGDYPSSACDPNGFLSYSLIVDSAFYSANNNVDFSGAYINVLDPEGNQMIVSGFSWDRQSVGLPNHLQWRVMNLQRNVRYTVVLTNLRAKENFIAEIRYWFRITE